MENKEPTFLELLLEAHIGLERQGPGSVEVTERALELLGPLDGIREAADLGCGTGGQTLVLAERLPGKVVGLDMFPDFVGKLNENAKARGLEDRVKGVVGRMEDLPFPKGSLDLIWSEGAIDNVGFREGLRHWRGFLRDGGFVAASCPSWLTKERPAAVEEFWAAAGSRLDAVETNVGIMTECGYDFVAAFVLPEECWLDNYYAPREKAIAALEEKYRGCDSVREYAGLNRKEVELFREYKRCYGYVFYIGKAARQSD